MSHGATGTSDRDRVLSATDLVALVSEHVALKPKGREHVGLCPFHDDRSPSLSVVTHKGDGFYKCFACGAAGNAIDFVMNFHKMTFGEALRHLAGRAGIELTDRFERRERDGAPRKDDLQRANAIALRFYRRMLVDDEGEVARLAIEERRIAPAMIEAFQLGYAPDRRDALPAALKRLESHAAQGGGREAPPPIEAFLAAGLIRDGRNGRADLLRHRIVFPIFDELGRAIAFGGRKIRAEDEPKYINSPESPLFHKSKSLYGIHLAKQSIIKSRVAVVTEGYTDVIACHEAGITNVVATLGTALTVEHARVLRRLCDTVILLFDGDAAGMKAADRGVEVFFSEPIDVKVCTLPDDLDPDELLRLPGGVDRFRAALAGATDALAYLVERFRAEYRARSGLSGRQQSLEALLGRLAELGFGSVSGVRKRFVIASLAHLTGVSEREIEAAMPAARPRRPEPRREGTSPAPDDASRLGSPTLNRDDQGRPLGAIPPGTGDDHDADDPNTACGPASTPIPRARRLAERGLLGLLLASPDLVHESVELEFEGEVATLPMTEALAPDRFHDQDLAEVYRTWRHCVDGGSVPSLARLLAELESPNLKGLASDLYLDGERRRGKVARETLEHLRTAFADLERLDQRSRFSADSPDSDRSPASPRSLDLAAAQDRLSQLRQRGLDATVVPRSLRG
ncbi:MAG: DNA primase [Phycisphaerales bacterium]